MNIIFKIQRYLKKNKSALCILCILILVVTNLVCLSSRNNMASMYRQELNENSRSSKIISELTAENTALTDANALLEADAAEHSKFMKLKDDRIIELEEELKKLKNPPVAASKLSGQQQAQYVWDYLIGKGLTIYVCSGIMGNIMAEVGGQTLDISRWPQYSKNTYYGICQWAGGRKQRLLRDYGTSLEAQVKFLYDEMLEVIPKGSKFYSLEDEKEAALYFAKHYERCSSKYYSIRQSNATKALNHFVG